jgi:glycosyltransferase involved in cell wall biosynthesis
MKLSIITINLNNPIGLQKTIESIVSQTYSEFELIVIDGGSTIDSIVTIRKYTDRIKYWISEPDDGIYQAMNKGIKQANGEYCFFLNSGDYFVNEIVLKRVFDTEFYEDILFGNLLVCLNGKLEGKSTGKKKLTFLDVYSSMIKHQSSFIKRQLFEKFGFFNENFKIISDWEFFIKTVGLGGATYRYIDIDISYFDNDGISNNSKKLVSEERKKVIENYIPSMMRLDYEYLLNYGHYSILTNFWVTNFFLRVLTKTVKVVKKISLRK